MNNIKLNNTENLNHSGLIKANKGLATFLYDGTIESEEIEKYEQEGLFFKKRVHNEWNDKKHFPYQILDKQGTELDVCSKDVFNKYKTNNIKNSNSKVINSINNLKRNHKDVRFKKGDTFFYDDFKYEVIKSFITGEQQKVIYQSIKSKDNGLPERMTEIIDQLPIIQQDLEGRLDKPVIINDETSNSFDIFTGIKLKAKDEDSYKDFENKLEKLEILDKDYTIGCFYDQGGYKHWKEHDFDNKIVITLDIENFQYNLSNLTTDLRDTLIKLESLTTQE